MGYSPNVHVTNWGDEDDKKLAEGFDPSLCEEIRQWGCLG